MLQLIIDRLTTEPLVPAGFLVCWLVLEWCALRRLRRDRLRHMAGGDPR